MCHLFGGVPPPPKQNPDMQRYHALLTALACIHTAVFSKEQEMVFRKNWQIKFLKYNVQGGIVCLNKREVGGLRIKVMGELI